MTRMAPNAGIAIGPVLMAIALIAVIIAALSAGTGGLGGAAVQEDRAVHELRGQIDLIRAKIDECTMVNRQAAAPQFLYPGFDQLDTALPVAGLNCPRDPSGRQNLWTGARAAGLPDPAKGFKPWSYVNHGDPDYVSPGGICIKTQPTSADSASDKQWQATMRLMLKRFSPTEYDFNQSTGVLVIWIRRPLSGNAC